MDYDIRHGRTYMYAKSKPLYPFGYGLSYSHFSYSDLRTDSSTLSKTGTVMVSVKVSNKSKVAGDSVVQLYVTHLKSAVSRPIKELKGFQRVSLKAGEQKIVTMALKATQLSYWDVDKKAFIVESEPVSVMVGQSSADIKLSKTIEVQ